MVLEEKYKKNINKMYAFSFISSLHFMGGVLIPFFMQWGKISFLQIMILQSFFTICVFLLETPTGAIADKYGRKVSIALGALVTGIAAFVYTLYPSFALFLIGEFIWAIGSALMSGADESLVYDTLKEGKVEKKSKKIFGRIGTAELLGLMIAAPIGSLIANYIGLRYTMMLIFIPLFIAFLIALSIDEPKIGRAKAREKSYFENLSQGIKFFTNHKVLRILAFDGAITSALIFFIVWVYQFKLQALNLSIGYFGFVQSALVLAQIGVLNSFSFFEGLAGSKKTYILLSALVPGLLFIALGFTSSILIAVICAMVIAAFGITRRTLFNNYMHKFIPSDKRAVVISTISMIASMTMVVNNLVMGWLVKWNIKYGLLALGLFIIIFSLVSRVKEEHLKD